MYKDFVVLQVEGISLVGQIFLPDKALKYPLVCLCHGVPSGNPPDPGDGGYPALAERVCHEGYAVFIFNFRGTGDSGGNMDLLGWATDLQSVVNYLWGLDNVKKSQVYLVGFSAGAATSVYIASKDKRISGVAACACPANFGLFTEADEPQSIIDRYRAIGVIRDDDYPPSLEGWFDNLKQVTPSNHIAGIAPRPLLLLHGSEDETVPLSHAHQLYDRAGEPKQLVVLDGAGHRLRQEERAVSAVLDWLRSVSE